MKFGPFAVERAEGAYLAHAVATPAGPIRKGTQITAEHITAFQQAGLAEVIAARLDPGDMHEDAAAEAIAAAMAGPLIRADRPATGRVNLFAEAPGLLKVEAAAIHAVNRIDPGITIATRPAMRGVETGRMVATVKIIPFAVPRTSVQAAIHRIGEFERPLQLLPYRPMTVSVISTLLPMLKTSTIEKTLAVLGTRLAPAGAEIIEDVRVAHRADALAAALTAARGELVIVFGASALVDSEDVIPAGIRASGGRIEHIGMPVDPGNLLILGEISGRPLIGAPGCARSSAENGFDFVLERVLAGEKVTAGDIMDMGVGGLLMDIVSRPAPRTGEALKENPERPQVAAVILAAGRSSRFADGHKLLALHEGKPLVRHAAEAALASKASEVIVVTGHQASDIGAALAGLDLRLVHNPDFASGQASSVRTGLEAVAASSEAAVVLLGDMPGVTAKVVDLVISAYRPAEGALVVVPTHLGKRGNPVLWSRRYFAAISALTGDQGARSVLETAREAVVTVEAGPSVLIDVDTVESLKALGVGTGEVD